MARVLLLEMMEEISSFNPMQSGYDGFSIQRGAELLSQRGQNSALGQAIELLAAAGMELVPAYGARAGSAGLLSAAAWQRLAGEFMAAARSAAMDADAVFVSMHGAMAADGELDPEGYLLASLRDLVGPNIPIVASLDLHGIMTARMLAALDAFAIYKTYPHVDFGDTGARASRLLLRLLGKGVNPVTARVPIPALVRGDELITSTGCYGALLADCNRLEQSGAALAAAIMIGNPFTDVPELCTQVLVTTNGDEALAAREASRLAEAFWALRHRMQGRLVALDQAIAATEGIEGPVVFTDAADATSSGATGDSNVIIRALRQSGIRKRVLAQIVDAPAAGAAHAAGVGAEIEITLGGRCDPARFTPLPVRAKVRHLWDGKARLETNGAPLEAGPTAVVSFDSFTVVVLSAAVMLFDRAMYFGSGLDPRDFDIIVVKSPHVEPHMYDAWVARSFNIDAPGATSADLRTLGHRICARPMFPLDEDVSFAPTPQLFGARQGWVSEGSPAGRWKTASLPAAPVGR